MSYNIQQLERDMETKKSKRPLLYMSGPHWGESAWSFLYNTILAFDGEVESLKNFLKTLEHVLPCEDCRTHYKTYLATVPIPDKTSQIFLWLMDLENRIAKQKYGVNFIPINRFRQVMKAGKTIFVEESPQKIIQKSGPCPNCQKNRMRQQATTPGVLVQNHSFLRNSSYFAKKI